MHSILGYENPQHETNLLIRKSILAALDDLRWASEPSCTREEAENRVLRAFSVLDMIKATPREINFIQHHEY